MRISIVLALLVLIMMSLFGVMNISLWFHEFMHWKDLGYDDRADICFSLGHPDYKAKIEVDGVDIKAEYGNYTISDARHNEIYYSQGAFVGFVFIMVFGASLYLMEHLIDERRMVNNA